MNKSSINQCFRCNNQILQIYSSTNLKPGAESAQIINYYDKTKKMLIPQELENAVTQLSYYATTEFSGVTYIIGGILNEDIPQTSIYTFKNYKFELVYKLPFPLYDAAAAANEEFLVIFGGRNGDSYLDTLLVFDKNLKMQQFPVHPHKQIFDLYYKNSIKDWPAARAQASICYCAPAFYLFGGAGRQLDRELWRLEIVQKGVSAHPKFHKIRYNVGPNPGFGGFLVAHKNRLVLVGGKGNENRIFKFQNNNWIDLGWTAYKSCQTGYFDGETLWFQGGLLEIACV
ncbi:hypothetical protein SS50377_20130 [Spironucleus salmonicida]|uniref:Kelch motif family protein n=1 Tax=Spironucleus salmonicida TaxID=348837 RepID=V6LNA1_9EUKA|nr:hypothetical protein SS50377_20130 [Spironucleus salmonicida]|eukprot:EST45186.1 Hypothetical protein SS50377_14759 [Spironucleus salmonicida]